MLDSSNPDEYDDFDLSEFTEEDFAQMDAAALVLKASPDIEIQIESEPPPVVSTRAEGKRREAEKSPLQMYRGRNILSVTDLVSLAWCEVQFDYGLRQKRSRPIASRPESFLSAAGKEITIEKDIAIKNDETTKQGRAIHKELEREIRSEELHVDISTDEERWALRLINMLQCLQCILTEGFTREMPVFGIIQDQVVVGIIDELVRRPRPALSFDIHTKQTSEHHYDHPFAKKYRSSPSPSELQVSPANLEENIELCFLPLVTTDDQINPVSAGTVPASHQYTLHLIDTKTRRTNSLPPHEDTLSSRLQLMVYHRLLADLMSTSLPFDFPSFWKRLDLNSSQTFSANFLFQAGLLADNGDLSTTCLDDLVIAWYSLVEQLDVPGPDSNLQIIYRLQPTTPHWKHNKKGKQRTKKNEVDTLFDKEEQDLAKAIEASLKDASREIAQSNQPTNVSTAEEIPNSASVSLQESSSCSRPPLDDPNRDETLNMDGDLAWALKQSLVSVGTQEVNDDVLNNRPIDDHVASSSNDTLDDAQTIDHLKIIGTKEFDLDEPFLDQHIANVLQWWHGRRKPRGVPLELSRRCFTCEYCADCEWRDQKASELREKRTLR